MFNSDFQKKQSHWEEEIEEECEEEVEAADTD